MAGRLVVADGDDLVAFHDARLVGRAAVEHADHERQLVLGDVDANADADVLAGQVVRPLDAFLGGQERGVAGVADGLGHPVDRAVDQIAIVELGGADVFLVENVPRLLDEAEVRG